MTGRYGNRTRSNVPVGNWGKSGGAALKEIIVSGSPSPAVLATPVTIAGVEYIVVEVIANTTLSFSNTPLTSQADVALIAGGGAGGRANNNLKGGGGGAGGAVISTIQLTSSPYPVTIGAGGSIAPVAGNDGSNTTAFSLTANGGGGGGGGYFSGFNGRAGGSGGGASVGIPNLFGVGGPSPFTPLQGYPGIDAAGNNFGGGGGAGGLGSRRNPPSGSPNLGAGGKGILLRFDGTDKFYAGGGGAGGRPPGPIGGAGGLGGGGDGGSGIVVGGNGMANTGGGGGGGGTPVSNNAGAGGSGIVLIRFRRFQA